MKSKIKKIIILTTLEIVLLASIIIPVIILNQKDDEKNQDEKDVNKVVKILEEKSDKTIVLASDLTGKIIANNNQKKIIYKLKEIIGSKNLKEIKIKVSTENDANISTAWQKIIIKLTKNKVSKEVKDFSIKRSFTASEDVLAIKKILDAKTGNDLIITLPNSASGNIISKIENKNAVEKKLRILIDSSNSKGEANHSSLRGTNIVIYMNPDAAISTTAQNIIVEIRKTGGVTFSTSKTFWVKKKNFTNAEKIANYFANNAKKTIRIIGGNALETSAKILTAVKTHLANDDSALWTNQLQSLITTHSSQSETSIVKDGSAINYSIAYDHTDGTTKKVDLTISHVSATRK